MGFLNNLINVGELAIGIAKSFNDETDGIIGVTTIGPLSWTSETVTGSGTSIDALNITGKDVQISYCMEDEENGIILNIPPLKKVGALLLNGNAQINYAAPIVVNNNVDSELAVVNPSITISLRKLSLNGGALIVGPFSISCTLSALTVVSLIPATTIIAMKFLNLSSNGGKSISNSDNVLPQLLVDPASAIFNFDFADYGFQSFESVDGVIMLELSSMGSINEFTQSRLKPLNERDKAILKLAQKKQPKIS